MSTSRKHRLGNEPSTIGRLGQSLLAATAAVLLAICMAGCGGRDAPRGNAQKSDSAPGPAAGPTEKAEPREVSLGELKCYPNEECQASIVQILAHRGRYHGKNVQIEGYLHVRFEGTAIYLSKDDAEYGITRNGFCVFFNKAAVPYNGLAGPTEYDRKYVLIEGTFDKDLTGHFSAWQGAIKNVTRVVELDRQK
ncbi:MAG: hypothetical protein ABR915_21035 [Thermoguttaceae bacterium]